MGDGTESGCEYEVQPTTKNVQNGIRELQKCQKTTIYII
jgi:hypothetical protein